MSVVLNGGRRKERWGELDEEEGGEGGKEGREYRSATSQGRCVSAGTTKAPFAMCREVDMYRRIYGQSTRVTNGNGPALSLL